MNLEQLITRQKDIEIAITNMSVQLNVLLGHKGEVAHWIQSLQPLAEQVQPNQVECDESTVVE